VPARSGRFSTAEQARALSLILAGMQRQQVAKTIGCTTESLRRWYAAGKEQGLVTKLGKSEDSAVAPAPPPETPAATSAPQDPGAGLSEHEVKAILNHKKQHPSMGPAQIRAQLKQFLGWRVSVKAIARVLRKAGYAPVHRKGRPVGDEHPRRFEAPHRNALWQLDFTELRIGPERRWLLVIEDDFSRFVVGHVLAEGPTSEVVVAALREAIRLHGKPERVYTDRGAAFTAWRDVTSCEQFLDEQLIMGDVSDRDLNLLDAFYHQLALDAAEDPRPTTPEEDADVGWLMVRARQRMSTSSAEVCARITGA
jgi:transposase